MAVLPDNRKSSPVSAPLISIIIATKNEEKNIETCLLSIAEQSFQPLEVIVVDNGSSDGTKEIARRYTEKVFDKGPERSAQRNFGMLCVAKGEYVMYVDSDMMLAPDLIERCVEFLKGNDCVALHIPEVVLGRGYWSCVRRFERGFYEGTVVDGARFFIRDVFIGIGGFDEHMSGPEDWDIDKKIKRVGKIGILPTASKSQDPAWKLRGIIEDKGVNPDQYSGVIFHNESTFDLKQYLSTKRYYAGSFNRYISKWGKNDPDVRRQMGLWYRLVGVFIEHGKWLRLLSKPHLVFGLYFLRLLVGIAVFSGKARA